MGKKDNTSRASIVVESGFTSRIMKPKHDPPQQYKQTSRKGKKAWRKNVDVSEVQAGLDNAREEIIQGSVPRI